MKRDDLKTYLDTFLACANYKDYCPNGLQAEGREEICRIVAGVSANLALIEEAVLQKADAVLVHHGFFWANEERAITGIRKKRLKLLLENDINLFAYHLPLDGHPLLGNNACLAKLFGFASEGTFGDANLGHYGSLITPMTLETFGAEITQKLKRAPLIIGEPQKTIRRIAWCSGGAQSYFEQATTLGVDAYLSGEISEHNVHLAREAGVAYIAAGHHATERLGIAALAEHLSAEKGITCTFVDIENPV